MSTSVTAETTEVALTISMVRLPKGGITTTRAWGRTIRVMRRKTGRLRARGGFPLASRDGRDRATHDLGAIGPEVESDSQNPGGHR